VAATRPDDLVAVRLFSQSWTEIRLLPGSMVSFLRPGHLMMAGGLRVADVDFMRGVISPAVQYPAEELKTEISKTRIPIPASLALELAAHLQQHPGETLLTSPAASSSRGGWSAPSARPAARWTASRQASGTTTCGTTSRRS
jgi:hypothetical protein